MKRLIRAGVITMAVAMLLCLTCFAGYSDALADELCSMNMFKGTDQGYELDKVPTRAQAAVMLVRLLGQEENANTAYASGEITHPYVDAKAQWVAPAVAYLHANGLTNGMGKNEKDEPVFGMQGECSAQMYCTFLLRALGYSDIGEQRDFTYSNAIDFAEEKGIVEDLLLAETFTRDTMVAASYQALSRPVKDGSGLLLEKLIASGAIDAEAAKATLQKMKVFQTADNIQLVNDENASYDMDMEALVEIGAPLNQTVKTVMSIRCIDGELPQMEYIGNVESGGEIVKYSIWLKDNWIYVDNGAGLKTKTQAMTLTDLGVEPSQSLLIQNGTWLYMFSDITYGIDEDGNYYTFKLAPRFYAILNQMMIESYKAAGLTVTINDVDIRYDLDQENVMSSMDMTMEMTMATEDTVIPMSISYYIKINAMGDDVVITYPDFSQFVEVEQ